MARARQKPQRSTSPYAADRKGDPCSGLVENVRWFYGVTSGDAKAFLLSAPVDKGEYSKTITELQEGQFCVLHFKVVQVQSGGQHAKVVEILNRPDKPSGWVFTFDDGHDRMAQGFLRLNGTYAYEKTVDVAWYRPGAWNKVRLEYCRDGRLRAAVNGILLERMITRNTGVVPITTRAYGLDVVFDG